MIPNKSNRKETTMSLRRWHRYCFFKDVFARLRITQRDAFIALFCCGTLVALGVVIGRAM